MGTLSDIERLTATVENYGFECEAGPLTNCGEWRYLKRLVAEGKPIVTRARTLKQTHTYVTLEVSDGAYNEIASKLRETGYDHLFGDDGEIDMHGLALVRIGGVNSNAGKRQPFADAGLQKK